jgi:hypothetical protein
LLIIILLHDICAVQRLAEEDAAEGHTFGLSALFSFYKSALLEAWDAELYKQFEEMALRYADYLDYQDGVVSCCCMQHHR